MDRKALARRIKQVSYLTGKFKLRSGKVSSFYWDKYRFESAPDLLDEIADHMVRILPKDYDKLAALELGGVPLATALSLRTGKPCLYVRKSPKDYGTCNLIEGGFSPGEKVLVVEDVITTGGQVCTSVQQIREQGLAVDHVLCAIDREQGGGENLKRSGCRLIALFKMSELEQLAQAK